MTKTYTIDNSPEVKRDENGNVISWLAGIDNDGFAVYKIAFEL